MYAGLTYTMEKSQEKKWLNYGEMNARWINAEIATVPIACTMETSHIVIVSDRFLFMPRGRRNATRLAPKRVNGKADLDFKIVGAGSMPLDPLEHVKRLNVPAVVGRAYKFLKKSGAPPPPP